ncbi:MAG: DMT family transporter [Desulfobacterales bacterium]|jgi:drug/metabolite transporter (DMT)-like permease
MAEIKKTTEWIPTAALLTASFLWGSSFIALKMAFTAFDPMVVIFGRMAVATLLFLFCLPKIRPSALPFDDLKLLVFMALCEPCLYFLFEAKALENTTASQAGMVTAMLPLMVAVAARRVLKEHISGRMLAGFTLAVAGVCWLSAGGEPTRSAPHPALGNFLEFLAMVCATGGFIALKRLTQRYSPWFLTAFQAVAGSLFYLPFLLLPGTEIPTALPLVPSLAVIYLGAVITIGAYGLYNYGVSRVPVSRASAFVNLIPVFAVVLGWIVLGERFTGPQYLASSLVFSGIYLSQSRPVRKRGPLAPSPGPMPDPAAEAWRQ